jgi:glycosyltransferase involved in cell wall biosynthesis
LKILTVNRNYFITGGPEKYMFSLMESMADQEFVPFCVKFSQNNETPYGKYFLDPPGGADNVYVQTFKMSVAQKIKFGLNMVYYREARRKLEKLIADSKPDVAFFLNAVHFTDSIIDACRTFGLPIVWRLSDFNKVCANYLLYRDGQVCEDCLRNGLHKAIVNRCGGYQRSRAVAAIKTTAMWLSRIRHAYDHVNYFITPTEFTRQKMIEGGFAPDKIVHIPTFIALDKIPSDPHPEKPGILYVGRLSPEKGVEILLNSFALMKNKSAILTIVGDTTGDYAQKLIKSIRNEDKSRVTFLGFKNQQEIHKLYGQHSVFVVPSQCYDNLPNVILEGMAHRRPAIVSRLGGLTETVEHNVTGFHFDPGNAQDLADKIDRMLDDPAKAEEMGISAYEYVKSNNSPQQHIASIEALFRRCIES